MLKYDLYLNDILRAIELIENSLRDKKFEDFEKNPDLVDSNSMRLQVIGESISKIPSTLRNKYKEVEWEKFIQTRNIISHAYFAVNKKILWDLIKKDIPKFKKIMVKIKKENE
jgi:uncharacterized protein with HEPN domain